MQARYHGKDNHIFRGAIDPAFKAVWPRIPWANADLRNHIENQTRRHRQLARTLVQNPLAMACEAQANPEN